MNKELLWESFSFLDCDLLERSERTSKRAPWADILKTAACFTLLAAMVAAPFFAARRVPVVTTSAVTDEALETAPASAAPEFAPDIAADVNAPMLPQTGASALLPPPALPMIESYPTNTEACYAAPKNGEVNRSMPLCAALDEYGDSARYRVIVDLFRDERPLDADGETSAAERERLAAAGYTVAYETLSSEWGERVRSYFTLHATAEQLERFPVSKDYGYMLFLYGELEKGSSDEIVTVSRPTLSTGSIPMDSVEIHELQPTP